MHSAEVYLETLQKTAHQLSSVLQETEIIQILLEQACENAPRPDGFESEKECRPIFIMWLLLESRFCPTSV